MAAEQGHIAAQTNLGVIYYEGRGVARDHPEAAKWYRKAAEQGNAEAQYNIGQMYNFGHGVPHDLMRAYMYFSLAAAVEEPDATVEKRKVADILTAQQIAEAGRLVEEWNARYAK